MTKAVIPYRCIPVWLAVSLTLLTACRKAETSPVIQRRFAMGTLVEVRLYANRDQSAALIDTAFAEIARIESLMSRHVDASEINRLTVAAVDRPVRCSPDLAAVLDLSLHYARLTQGRFDVTVGPLTALWGFPGAIRPPAQSQIDSALTYVDYRNLELDGEKVRLHRAGMQLDLGAAAKGYAVDRAVARLREMGVEAGLVEAGGDIRYWGRKPDGSTWRFGVQHPRAPDRFATVEDIGLPAIATSGDYQQYFEYESQRYHHLLDALTGHPASEVISVTVWAESALEADILSTALFVAGAKEGAAMAARLPQVEALIHYQTDTGMERILTDGLHGRVRFWND